jgi:hypothetical protein
MLWSLGISVRAAAVGVATLTLERSSICLSAMSSSLSRLSAAGLPSLPSAPGGVGRASGCLRSVEVAAWLGGVPLGDWARAKTTGSRIRAANALRNGFAQMGCDDTAVCLQKRDGMSVNPPAGALLASSAWQSKSAEWIKLSRNSPHTRAPGTIELSWSSVVPRNTVAARDRAGVLALTRADCYLLLRIFG